MGTIILSLIFLFLFGVFIYDRFIQKKHIITKHFPVIGHLRYALEMIGPEMRQYFVAQNREELPFNRIQRSYIYASAKQENNSQGFGSDADFNKTGNFFIKHAGFAYRKESDKPKDYLVPNKVIGCRRKYPYTPTSIINISGMSYGALGSGATTANNKGAKIAGCYHNTGEGGFSKYHDNGADVVFQIGTAYYGCRDESGRFSMDVLVELIRTNPCIKMIEVKLSQGAKPGKGGILPAEKVTPEIAAIRKAPVGVASISPGFHTQFSTVDELIAFVEKVAEKTGLPVGIKSAVGQSDFWVELASKMTAKDVGPDFITIDGGEGGTGAAPSAFADHVSLPFDSAFTTVFKIFNDRKICDKITFIASAKLGLPANAVKAFAMGADMINVAREILIAGGCIQAQKCHTGNCPSLVATNKKQHLYNVDYMAARVSFYIKTFRKDVLELTHAAGYEHPSHFKMSDIVVNTPNSNKPETLEQIYNYTK